MSLNIEEQKDILSKEFMQVEVAPDQKLTKDELYLKLDQKLGKKFERMIADQLIAKLDTDEDGKIVAEQFYLIIIEAEQSLISKIEQCRTFLSQYKQSRNNVVLKYESELQTEKKNQFNIMIGSLLFIKPLETNCGEDTIFVKVQCGLSQEILQWNQESQFPIQTSTEDITVALLNLNGDEPIGLTHIQLNGLRDQKKVEKWVDLTSFDGRTQKVGRLKLELHWIHSKVELYENVILTWDNQIKLLEEDLYGHQNDLTTLLQPFPGLFQIVQMVDNYQDNQQFDSNNPNQFNSKGQRYKQSSIDDPYTFIPSSQQSIQVSEVHKILAYSNLVYMVIAIFLSFNRVVYLDMLICMSYFVEIYTKSEYNITNFKLYSFASMISFGFEILWLVLFTLDWWQVMPGYRIRRGILIFSFVFAIVKAVLIGLYIYLYSDMKKNPEQKFSEQNIFDNITPKGSFAVGGENQIIYQNKMKNQYNERDSQIQNLQEPPNTMFFLNSPQFSSVQAPPPNMYQLNSPSYPAQPNIQNSRIAASNNFYQNGDFNQTEQLSNAQYNNNRISSIMNSNRPSMIHLPEMNRNQSIKNNFQGSSMPGDLFSSPQINLPQLQLNSQQQSSSHYVSRFDLNNFKN